MLAFYAYDLPDVGQVAQAERRPTVTVLAADGSTIERYGDIYGTTINAADLPASGLLARVGGDEFAVVTESLTEQGIDDFCQQILRVCDSGTLSYTR